VESCKFALVGNCTSIGSNTYIPPSAQAESTIILITSTSLNGYPRQHIMRMDRSDRECLVLATFVPPQPLRRLDDRIHGGRPTHALSVSQRDGQDLGGEPTHVATGGSPNTFLATHCSDGCIRVNLS
jgi:hypothetical protein